MQDSFVLLVKVTVSQRTSKNGSIELYGRYVNATKLMNFVLSHSKRFPFVEPGGTGPAILKTFLKVKHLVLDNSQKTLVNLETRSRSRPADMS